MTTKQTIWLIIRLAGVYFAYQAVFIAVALVGQLWQAGQGSEAFQRNAWPVLVVYLGQLVFYVMGSIYLIGDGTFLFYLLNREDGPRETGDDLRSSSLNLDS